MRIFKRKTTQLIEERAKKEQRSIDHKLRLADEKRFEERLRDQRNLHAESSKKLETDLIKQFEKSFNAMIKRKDNRIKRIINDKNNIIKQLTTEKKQIVDELLAEIETKNSHIKDNQLAWVRITEVMPRLKAVVTKYRMEKEVEKLSTAAECSKAASKYKGATECEDDLEAIDRTFEKINPKIQELLHMNSEEKHNHERFIQNIENK